MNFARVICDRRAAQSIMRNIAFALQARNHTRLFVSERVPIPPSDSVEICFESTIAKPDRSSRSARIVQRKINSGFGSAADIPALQHDRVVDGARKLAPCDRPRWPPRCRRQRVAVHQARRKRSRPIWPRGEFRLSYPAGGPRRSIQRNDFIFITLHARIT
jgi:hypothetical protein